MKGEFEVTSTGLLVGEWWLQVDHIARAISVTPRKTREAKFTQVKTEDMGNGVLVDRDKNGQIVGVEFLS